MMTKKEWLIAAILTFITISAWVIFDILHSRAKVDIPPKVQEVIEPISPEFDLSGLQSATDSAAP